MKKILVLTIIDVFIICSPIVILFFVIIVADLEPGDIWKKPEWSYISILLFVESFRDYRKAWKKKEEYEIFTESHQAMLAILLVLIALVLVIDFRHSLGLTKPDKTAMIYMAKFLLFGCCMIFFAVTKWKKYSILGFVDDLQPITGDSTMQKREPYL